MQVEEEATKEYISLKNKCICVPDGTFDYIIEKKKDFDVPMSIQIILRDIQLREKFGNPSSCCILS